MSSLFVIQGRDQGNRFELDSSAGPVTVGRESSCTIQLHDTEVSRLHAEVRRAGRTVTLTDLNSSNGTFVNKQRVERHELASGDQVQIGRTVMLYTGVGDSSLRNIDERIRIVGGPQSSDNSRIVRTMRQEEGSQIFSAEGVDQTQSNWLARAHSNLQVMYRTALAVSHTLDIDQLLGRIMQLIFEWVEADRGCIMLVDPETKELRPKVRRDRKEEFSTGGTSRETASRNETGAKGGYAVGGASAADGFSSGDSASVGATGAAFGGSDFSGSAHSGSNPSSSGTSGGGPERITISRTILDYVMEHKEGVLTSDARDDQRWDAAQSIVRQGVREAICVPMQGRYDIVGVIYIDTMTTAARLAKRGGKKFTDEHLKLMVAIGHQAALAVEDTNYYSAMVQAERLAAVGQTIATLSHHIKNILQGIRGGSYLIEMGLNDHDESITRKGWDIVEKNQNRISTLVMDMLTFSKEREPELGPANLNETIADVLELMRARADEKQVELLWQPAVHMPTLVFDAEGIHRATLNVITNAIDACADNLEDGRTAGRVSVHVAAVADQSLAQVVVADNGSGIAEEDIRDIFNLFVSRKGSRGTGLGLPVSQKILKEHGGAIRIESEPGHGSTFFLEFPLVRPEADKDDVRQTMVE